MSEDDAKAKERLAKVAEQVNRMDAMGEKFDLQCPYCCSIVGVGMPFCCHKLYDAVGVILEARDRFSNAVMKHTVN